MVAVMPLKSSSKIWSSLLIVAGVMRLVVAVIVYSKLVRVDEGSRSRHCASK